MNKANITENINIYPGTNGQAVLFIHGFGGKPAMLGFLFKYLNRKGYTVYSPILLGHDNFENLDKYRPEDWITQAEGFFTEIKKKHEKVFLIGASFGGNICINLAGKFAKEIKGVLLLETPIFFNFKIALILKIFLPIFEFLNISRISKNRFVYRSRYAKDGHSVEFLPIKAVGEVYRFIKNEAKGHVAKVSAPIYIFQGEKSDLIRKKSASFIFDNVKSMIKKVEFLPIDNHDFDLFDEKDRIIMMEKMYDFMSKV